MSERKRKNFSSQFKAKVALEAIRGVKTVTEIAQAFGVHPTQVGQWKKVLQDQAAGIFDTQAGQDVQVNVVQTQPQHQFAHTAKKLEMGAGQQVAQEILVESQIETMNIGLVYRDAVKLARCHCILAELIHKRRDGFVLKLQDLPDKNDVIAAIVAK